MLLPVRPPASVRRLALVLAASAAVVGCDASDAAARALQPPACGEACAHCAEEADRAPDRLAPPPVATRTGRRAVAPAATHRVLAEVRSHDGVPAAGVLVEVWHLSRDTGSVLEGSARTDVDGVAAIPFGGRGVYCIHAIHDEVGRTTNEPKMLQLGARVQDWPVELVLPESDVPIPRAGIAQVGVAGPDGAALEGACVAVWRYDFGVEDPTLSASAVSDARGVVRVELDRPGFYAVSARHPELGEAAGEYLWYAPRSPRGERRVTGDAPTRSLAALDWVACDAHLRVGARSHRALHHPFEPHDLGGDRIAPASALCCRTWVRE